MEILAFRNTVPEEYRTRSDFPNTVPGRIFLLGISIGRHLGGENLPGSGLGFVEAWGRRGRIGDFALGRQLIGGRIGRGAPKYVHPPGLELGMGGRWGIRTALLEGLVDFFYRLSDGFGDLMASVWVVDET